MAAAPPRPLALHEEPSAVLLLDTARPRPAADGGPRVLAATASADTADVPADLAAFCRAEGFGELAARPHDDPWLRASRGVEVAGELLAHSVSGDLWLRAVPVDGLGWTLLVVHRTEGPVGPGPGSRAVVAGPGTALSALSSAGEWIVEWVDDGYTRTTGTPAHDVVGRSCHHLLRHSDPDALTELSATVAAARPGLVTTVDTRADGSAFLHRVLTTPLLDRSGRVCHLVSWHVDVTGRVAAEDSAQRARDEARAAEEFAQRLDLLGELDAVVVADDSRGGVLGGLAATTRVLTRHVVADALIATTVERPGGPRGVEAEIVAVAGDGFAALAGHRLRRSRGRRPQDPLLRRPDGARPEPVALLTTGADDDAATPSGWLATLVGSTGAREAYAVPMVGREDVVGLLVVVPRVQDGSGLGPADTAVVVGAARRAGLLAENSRLHAREHALAETLQRSMLPGSAEVDGLDVWTFYASNGDHPQVGGDWYDVLATGHGTAGVVIGDVVGHDVEAAAAMGQIRTVVRSAALELDDPGSVLRRVDQLAGGLQIPRMASLVYAGLQRLDDGGWEMAWSSAGHLPPLLRRASGPDEDGRVEVLSEATGTLLGLGERPRPTRERALGAGDTVVFYTDGLIETRSRPMRDGLEVLVEALAASRAVDAAGIGEELLNSLGESPEDDTAIVVVRVPEDADLDAGGRPLPQADTPRRRRWQLPSEASSVGKARHATLRACAVWGLTNGPQAEIVVSELVANAVLHGWGTVGLRLFDLPDGLRIEVEDDSPEEPRVVDARADGGGGHGMRVVDRLGRWGWTPTRRGKIVWVELHPAPTTAPLTTPDHEDSGRNPQ